MNLFGFEIDPGYLGVAIGVMLFLMGRASGFRKGVSEGVNATIDTLIEQKYLKSRAVLRNGVRDVELMKHDEA